MNRTNLAILMACQLMSATGSFTMVTLAGPIGTQLSSRPAFATLPVSVIIVVTALTTIPATMLMQRIGRNRGFALSSLSAVAAMLIATYALRIESFALFVAGAAMFGINLAFTQQYRYAAAESVEPRYTARAISFVLLGAIGGAFAGQQVVLQGAELLTDVAHGGSMLLLAGLYVLQAILVLQLRGVRESGAAPGSDDVRSIRRMALQPVFIVAVLGATAGYGLMSLVMTATPISMHVNDGFSLAATSAVILAHVVAMYSPSLVSGFLIEKLGVVRMMSAGALLLLVTSIVGLQGHSVMHYWWALVMLGVGWNFLYVGGTTMLTLTYRRTERFRAQAVNEAFVFSTAAVTSLLAGAIMSFLGWFWLMLVPLPVLAIVLVALAAVRRDPLLLAARG